MLVDQQQGVHPDPSPVSYGVSPWVDTRSTESGVVGDTSGRSKSGVRVELSGEAEVLGRCVVPDLYVH